MACIEDNIIPRSNAESEMEEGEIVDELDDLSDVSSEEEFLLRQRLEVLENYNNVLERKKAKRSSTGSGKQRDVALLHDYSEISGTDLDDTFTNVYPKAGILVSRNIKDHRSLKSHHKQKKRKEFQLYRDIGRKGYKKRTRKKKFELKVLSETSEESEDEYRNKRRKLADAVIVPRKSNAYNDKTSLQSRLQKMLNKTNVESNPVLTADKETGTDANDTLVDVSCSPIVPATINIPELSTKADNKVLTELVVEDSQKLDDIVDISTDDDVVVVNNEQVPKTVGLITVSEETHKEENASVEKDSDDDLELLRQHALNTKSSKTKTDQPTISAEPETEVKPIQSEDEDSDTAELRLICLKSALLKKAIEMKRKQKLQKRLSQSSNLQDDLFNDQQILNNKTESEHNNTDIESVDMDIGSDGEDKVKHSNDANSTARKSVVRNTGNVIIHKENASKEDELEEDEDLLRAKLLTSLSKNLPNLVDPNILNSAEQNNVTENVAPTMKTKTNVPEQRRIVINVGESDSEGEHEATKNLTKMHIKLSEQIDFQQKLDLFLKSTRMEVENSCKEPVIENKKSVESPQKFVAKAVNHLPKSVQMEYKNLVKRMAELEKVKQARQTSMNIVNNPQVKETLKPRNVTVVPTKLIMFNNNLEEQIALSRKNIAEESTKLLKLKEEASKLSQKYKIVATELRNISTAITLNKREQKSAHIRLSKSRLQHQRLLNSTNSKHSGTNGQLVINRLSDKMLSTTKLQKENDPSKEDINPTILKAMKVNSLVNEFRDETPVPTRLSIQVDVSSNKKVVKVPSNDRLVDTQINGSKMDKSNVKESSSVCDFNLSVVGEENIFTEKASNQKVETRKEFDDYESPLQALETVTWGDPNAILCPFEVGGHCKDSDCNYLHPKVPTQQ